MDNQTEDNSTSFKEQFDPSLVSEIIISVDAGDKKSLLSIIKNYLHLILQILLIYLNLQKEKHL